MSQATLRPRWLLSLTLFGLASTCATASDAAPRRADLVIYGCTSAGVIAAISARQHGNDVALVCERDYVGGMTTNGLGWSDVGNHRVIGGLSLEFYRRIKAHYDVPAAWRGGRRPADADRFVADGAQWVFEPHVAETIYRRWLEQVGIVPVFDARLDRGQGGVVKSGRRIVSIRSEDGRVFSGAMFIDATYEGDLLAAAGVSFTVGREANSLYGETANGVEVRYALHHQFMAPVDAYKVPGRPESGLLPHVSAERPGPDGAGDDKVQAYTFRLCLTDVPENQTPIAAPADYDPGEYELLARYLRAGFKDVFRKFDRIPNGKTDVNNWGAFSFDAIGMSQGYPEADYATRARIVARHRSYQQGLLYFLGHDPSSPDWVRAEMSRWGLCRDEFPANGNWPREIYVREARRMVSEFVMTERHLTGKAPTPQPVGMGSYNMDSHNVQRYADEHGRARNEGNIEWNPGAPYPISYQAMTPRRSEAENLLAPVALSASHIAFGSIRMEPVFMILGESAAAAASLALREGTSVQDVPYETLKRDLLARGQILEPPQRP